MKRLLLLCLLGCTLCASASTDALDGLVSWWKFNGVDANGNGAADAAETVDLMSVGRAGGMRQAKGMTRNFETGAVVTFATVETETPYHGHGAVPYTDTFLYFPQPYDAEAGTLAKATARLDGALKTSGTIRLKFKWAGGFSSEVAPTYCLFANAYEWSNSQGYALYIFGTSGDTEKGTLVIRIGQDQQTSLCTIQAGVWYDLVLKVDLLPEAGQTIVDAYLADRANVFAFNGITHVRKTLNRAADFSVATWIADDFTLASETPEDGQAVTFSYGSAKCFRGYMGDLQLFDRLLSEREVYSLMMGAYGSTWAVGAVNGSADEFAGAANTTGGVAVEAWRTVANALASSGDTLTLSAPLDVNDEFTIKYLVLYPIVADAPAAEVDVQINGVSVKRVTLSSTRKVVALNESLVRNGADGNFVLALRRVDDAGGKLSFDAIRLCGSWQIGTADAYPSSDDFSNCGRVGPHYFSGDSNAKHAARGTEGIYNFKTYNYTFFNPKLDARLQFEALVCNVRVSGSEVTDALGMRVLLNGTHLATYSPLKRLDKLAVELPLDELVSGLNTVTLEMINQPSNDCQVYLDYARVIQGMPRAGLTVILR